MSRNFLGYSDFEVNGRGNSFSSVSFLFSQAIESNSYTRNDVNRLRVKPTLNSQLVLLGLLAKKNRSTKVKVSRIFGASYGHCVRVKLKMCVCWWLCLRIIFTHTKITYTFYTRNFGEFLSFVVILTRKSM